MRRAACAIVLWLTGMTSSAAEPPNCRPTVAVLGFRPRNAGKEVAAVQSTLLALITDRLVSNRAVRVVERERLDAVISELQLNDSDSVDPKSRQSVGRAIAAAALLDGRFLMRGNEISVEYSCLSVSNAEKLCSGTQTTDIKDIARLSEAIAKEFLKAAARSTSDCLAATASEHADAVAVFIFDDETGDGYGAVFAEALALDLSRLKTFRVVERSQFAAIKTEISFQAINANPESVVRSGRLLGAKWIVYGRVVAAGDKNISVEMKVANVETGEILGQNEKEPRDWLTGRSDRTARQLFELMRRLTSMPSRAEEDLAVIAAARRKEAQHYLGRAHGLRNWWTGIWEGNALGFKLAEAELRRAVFVDPAFTQAYFDLSENLRSANDRAQAREVLLAMIRRHPTLIPSVSDYAMAEFWLGTVSDCDEGIGHYRKGIATKTLGYLEYNSRQFIARCLDSAGKIDEAIAEYESLRKDKHLDWGADRLGYLYERRGEIPKAIEAYQAASPNSTAGSMKVSERGEFLQAIKGLGRDAHGEFIAAEQHPETPAGRRMLEKLTEKRAGTRIGEKSLDMLVNSYREACRTGPLELAECRAAFRPLALRSASAEMHKKIVSLYLHMVPHAEQRKEDHQYLIDRLPKTDPERSKSLFELASIAYYIDRNPGRAKPLLLELLAQSTTLGDADSAKNKEKAKEILGLIDQARVWSGQGSAEKRARDARINASHGDFSNCGYSFAGGGFFVEALRCWKMAKESTKSPQRLAHIQENEGRMLECVGNFDRAIDAYQALIDQHLFTENGTAKSVQARLDAIVRNHATAFDKSVRAKREKALDFALAQVDVGTATMLIPTGTEDYFSEISYADDDHGHCPATYTPRSNARSKTAPELMIRLLDNLKDSDRAVRREASRAVLELAKSPSRGIRDIGGIGAVIDRPEQELIVSSVIAHSPAAEAGLLAGDVILAVDESSAGSLTQREAVSRIRGAIGTTVVMRIRSSGASEPRDLPIIRRSIVKFDLNAGLNRLIAAAIVSEDPEVRADGIKSCKVLENENFAACNTNR